MEIDEETPRIGILQERVDCGWKHCYETFPTVMDMNTHVQMNHMKYTIQIAIQPFSRPKSPFQVDYQFDDAKPQTPIEDVGASSSQDYYTEDVQNQIPPPNSHENYDIDLEIRTTESIDGTEAAAAPSTSSEVLKSLISAANENLEGESIAAKLAKSHLSKFWKYTKNGKYRCVERNCLLESPTSYSAIFHYYNSHPKSAKKKMTSGTTGTTTTKKIKCAHRGCSHYYSNQERADNHYAQKHGKNRSRDEMDDAGEKVDLKIGCSKQKDSVPEAVKIQDHVY